MSLRMIVLQSDTLKSLTMKPLYIAKMFASKDMGMEVAGFDRAFCPSRETMQAKKVKPDVVIDSTASASPDLPIDSDGALMFNRWLKVHYISAALYAVPSNYYVKKYRDVRSESDEFGIKGVSAESVDLLPKEKKRLGNLFKMVEYRPEGEAELESFGNWVLKDGDMVNAITMRGETVVYYPTVQNDTVIYTRFRTRL